MWNGESSSLVHSRRCADDPALLGRSHAVRGPGRKGGGCVCHRNIQRRGRSQHGATLANTGAADCPRPAARAAIGACGDGKGFPRRGGAFVVSGGKYRTESSTPPTSHDIVECRGETSSCWEARPVKRPPSPPVYMAARVYRQPAAVPTVSSASGEKGSRSPKCDRV